MMEAEQWINAEEWRMEIQRAKQHQETSSMHIRLV
jgi:hypothetical protein